MKPASSIDIGALIDRGTWSGYQRRLVVLSALTLVFDGVDLQLMGVVIPEIMRDWAVARSAFAPVLAVGMIGMLVGAAAAGIVGDRYGRKRTLLGSIVVFGAASVAMAASTSLLSLGLLRLVVGFGIGGAIPNASALVAEYVPARHRPLAVTFAIVCVPLGASLAGLLAAAVVPVFGWRALFVAGGVIPLAAALLLSWALVESPRYLARRPDRWPELERILARFGHSTPADASFSDSAEALAGRATVSALLEPSFRRDTLGLWAAFASCLLAVYLGFNWIPAMLTGAGLSPTLGSLGITMFNFGGVIGAIAGALAFYRIGSRTTMIVMSGGAAAGAAALAFTSLGPDTSTGVLMTLLAITGGLINAVQTTMYALAAQMYPAAIRSTGVGTAAGIGRVGAIGSTYIGAWAIEGGGSVLFFATVALAMVLTAAGLSTIERHIRPTVSR